VRSTAIIKIAQVMLFARALSWASAPSSSETVVFDGGRWIQNFTIEVAQHPFEACLGAIDADDAESLRPDLLHAR